VFRSVSVCISVVSVCLWLSVCLSMFAFVCLCLPLWSVYNYRYYLLERAAVSVCYERFIVSWIALTKTASWCSEMHTRGWQALFVGLLMGTGCSGGLSTYSIWESVYMSICPFYCLSVYLSVYLSVCLSVHPSVYPSVSLSIGLSVACWPWNWLSPGSFPPEKFFFVYPFRFSFSFKLCLIVVRIV